MQAYENGLYLKESDQLPNNFQIVKAIINGERCELNGISDKVHQLFDKNYFVVRTEVGLLEVFFQNVNKDVALEALCNKLNINLNQWGIKIAIFQC